MKKVWVREKSYKYIKTVAKIKKDSMLNVMDFILDVFQQVPVHAITPPKEFKPYMTYRRAFYDQSKHKLKEHQRKFFEQSRENMNIFFHQNKKELSSFKAAFALKQKNIRHARLKEYNKKYYLNNRKDKHAKDR